MRQAFSLAGAPPTAECTSACSLELDACFAGRVFVCDEAGFGMCEHIRHAESDHFTYDARSTHGRSEENRVAARCEPSAHRGLAVADHTDLHVEREIGPALVEKGTGQDVSRPDLRPNSAWSGFEEHSSKARLAGIEIGLREHPSRRRIVPLSRNAGFERAYRI